MGFWAVAIPAAISLASSIMGKSAADRAADMGEQQFAYGVDLKNKQIALGNWLLDDWKKNGLEHREELAKEAFGEAPTAAYGRELGSFRRGMASAEDKILASSNGMPTGLSASLVAGLGFQKAMGEAKLLNADNERKQALKDKVVSLEYATPGGANAALNSLGQGGDYFARMGDAYNQQAGAGYAGAAAAMGNLARFFTSGEAQKAWNS